MSATVSAAFLGGIGAYFLLGLGFSGAPHEMLWILIAGLLVAGFFLARSPKSSVWLLTLCLSGPCLFFTIQSTVERFLRGHVDAGRGALVISTGIFVAALLGASIGKLSLRTTRKI
jgi:hypothetical protein